MLLLLPCGSAWVLLWGSLRRKCAKRGCCHLPQLCLLARGGGTTSGRGGALLRRGGRMLTPPPTPHPLSCCRGHSCLERSTNVGSGLHGAAAPP